MSSGLQNYVGFGKETTFGTEVTPTVYLSLKESDGIQINQSIQMIEAIKNSAPKNKDAFIGKVELAGGFNADVYPQFIGHPLYSVLGAVNSALLETGVYKHTFTESLTKKSYTVEQKIGEVIKRFAGYMVKNLKVEAKVGETVGISFEGIAKTHATNAGTTPAYETPRPFNFKDVTLVKIGSVDVTGQCEELSLEYDNGIQGFYAMADNNLKSIYPTPSECKGKLTLYLDNTTKDFLTDYINKTVRSLEIKMEGDTIGSSNKNTLRLLITKAVLTSVPMKLAQDYNVLEIEFEAIEDATDGILKIELTNTLSSY